ncbi:MAG: dihydrolipoamide acetyltransferase family protein [Ramlibacter sp.]
MHDFLMPALGADMEKGKLVQWNVQPGARVKPGDVVAVVETQKGAIDVEIFLDGTIEDLVPVGTEMAIGDVMARVRAEGEVAPAASVVPAPRPPQAPRAAAPAATPAPAMASATATATVGRPRASPGARHRAAELHVDLARVHGSGPQGSITQADVEAAAAPVAVPARAARPGGFDPAQMRAAIAAAMGRSKREIPHYYLGQAIDFAAAGHWLDAYNAERPPAERLLPAVLLLKACALALKAVPQLNGFWRDGAVQLSDAVHVGWAVSLRGGGLVAPAVHHADRLGLGELMAELRDLVQRARTGGLRSSELSDPTVTVTSLGERGADSVLAVIYPPQLAVIGFGRIAQRPWVADGGVVARPVLQVSLAADHRASDGHVGAKLLAAIDDALQQPQALERSAP